MSSWVGVAVAVPTAAYALVSQRLAATPVSGPMVFVGVGLGIGPLGLDLLTLDRDPELLLGLLELTLVLVLFTDAQRVRVASLRRDEFLPLRLLAIGLPLTIGLGWLLAWPLLPGLSVWELALVGIVLAPTDGALGLAAISNRGVPALVREGLNVESGLNDGMALPFFVLALAATVEGEGGAGPVDVFIRALLLSAAIGVVVGGFGGRFLLAARAREWIDETWQQLFVVIVALLGYALALVVEGSGFIAAWAAGLSFAAAIRSRTPTEARLVRHTAEFSESLATLLTALSFLVFGAVLLGPALQHLEWRVVVYALLSLTVIRLLPVQLALSRSGLKLPTVGYIGWFGPRGLASIVLGLLVAEAGAPGADLVADVIAVTVGISVVAHGVSSGVLANRYASWYAKASARSAESHGAVLRETSSGEVPEQRQVRPGRSARSPDD
ncbi:MAG: sodium/hydrogen antiporter [Frankiaceae bacterium]|jgi:NhaP-type Na+/H+ or K+/H+ antiporter|nr:sodium/hydrogen antiporter [Frankiaceae bacterium]